MGIAPQIEAVCQLGKMPDAGARGEHRTLGVVFMSKWSITAFELRSDFKIAVTFADGTSGIVDLSPRLSQGPLGDGFDPLCDKSKFSMVHLNYGALTWPGGIDLAPDAMYDRIRESGISVVAAKGKVAA